LDKDEAMSNPRLALGAAACLAALCIIGVTTVEAKQACNVAAGAQGYWSWRMIDGRKCWYEGKPMLSKDLLEWAAATPSASAQPPAEADTASAPAMRRGGAMDAQASMRGEPPTFDALWRSRIENK
jgi:hypothetical protein